MPATECNQPTEAEPKVRDMGVQAKPMVRDMGVQTELVGPVCKVATHKKKGIPPATPLDEQGCGSLICLTSHEGGG